MLEIVYCHKKSLQSGADSSEQSSELSETRCENDIHLSRFIVHISSGTEVLDSSTNIGQDFRSSSAAAADVL